MAGNEYGPRGPPSELDIKNRKIEETIKACVEAKFEKRFSEYGTYVENHSTHTFGNLSSHRVLETRNITVRLGRPDSAYRVKFNTQTNELNIRKPNEWHPDLKPADIEIVVECIKSALATPAQRRGPAINAWLRARGVKDMNRAKNEHFGTLLTQNRPASGGKRKTFRKRHSRKQRNISRRK